MDFVPKVVGPSEASQSTLDPICVASNSKRHDSSSSAFVEEDLLYFCVPLAVLYFCCRDYSWVACSRDRWNFQPGTTNTSTTTNAASSFPEQEFITMDWKYLSSLVHDTPKSSPRKCSKNNLLSVSPKLNRLSSSISFIIVTFCHRDLMSLSKNLPLNCVFDSHLHKVSFKMNWFPERSDSKDNYNARFFWKVMHWASYRYFLFLTFNATLGKKRIFYGAIHCL